MTLATLKSDNLVGMELDALEATLPDTDRTTLTPLRAIEAVYTAAATDARAAVTSGELTRLGQQEAAKRAIAKAHEMLKPHEAEAARLEATVAATRTQALQPPATFTPDPMLSREIRDRLQGADPLAIRVQYFKAIGSADWPFVHAVEASPQAFVLIDRDTRQAGDAMKIEHSPLKARLDAEERAHRRLAGVVATVRTELGRLADAYGLPREE